MLWSSFIKQSHLDCLWQHFLIYSNCIYCSLAVPIFIIKLDCSSNWLWFIWLSNTRLRNKFHFEDFERSSWFALSPTKDTQFYQLYSNWINLAKPRALSEYRIIIAGFGIPCVFIPGNLMRFQHFDSGSNRNTISKDT